MKDIIELDQLRKSLIVCDNDILKKEIINKITELIENDLNNSDKDILIQYQQTIHYIKMYHSINLNNTVDILDKKLSDINIIQSNNYHNLLSCIEQLPFWVDKKYLSDLIYNSLIKDFNLTLAEKCNTVEVSPESSSVKEIVDDKSFSKQFSQSIIIEPKTYDYKLVENVTDEEYTRLSEHLEYLTNLPQPEQRSNEWYEYRNNMLTASDLYNGIAKHGKTRLSVIYGKCGVKRNISGGASCLHGVRYEDVAIAIYEKRNKCKVVDYGCIQHPELNIFGASPDGIVSNSNKQLVGRMLEIKCPYSREITGKPKIEYFTQIQGQLEVCDLEYCDFLECKIRDYKNFESMIEDTKHIENVEKLERGVIIQVHDMKLGKDRDIICPIIDGEKEDYERWIEEMFDKIIKEDNLEYVKHMYWKLHLYSCVLVKRDKKLFDSFIPEIKQFWNEVEHYREVGIIEEKPKRKDKRKKEDEYDLNCGCIL